MKKPLPRPNSLAITGKRAISEDTAFIISHILQDNAARTAAFGPTSQLVVKSKTVSVKTGTTDDLRDNWTIGYTPNFLVTVWVGNNDFTPMNPYLVSGVTGAAPIWNKVMTELLKNQPNLPPIKPSTVLGMQVCSDTGVIAGKQGDSYNCPTRFEYLIKGTNANTTIKREVVPVNKDTDQLARPGDPNVEMREKTVLHDAISIYCVDCAHAQEGQQVVNP